jgi:hypothetical protein
MRRVRKGIDKRAKMPRRIGERRSRGGCDRRSVVDS